MRVPPPIITMRNAPPARGSASTTASPNGVIQRASFPESVSQSNTRSAGAGSSRRTTIDSNSVGVVTQQTFQRAQAFFPESTVALDPLPRRGQRPRVHREPVVAPFDATAYQARPFQHLD